MKTMLNSLTNSFKNLEDKVNSQWYQSNQQYRPNFNRRRNRGRFRGNFNSQGQPRFQNPQAGFNASQGYQNNFDNYQNNFNQSPLNNFPDNTDCNVGSTQNNTSSNYAQQNQAYDTDGDYFNRDPLCFKCGLYGHYCYVFTCGFVTTGKNTR